MEPEERLSLLQWTLERQLHWINSADTKAGALIAVYVAATATAATLLNDVDPTALEKGFLLISGFSALPGLLLAIAVFFPRIEGPKDSGNKRGQSKYPFQTDIYSGPLFQIKSPGFRCALPGLRPSVWFSPSSAPIPSERWI